MFLLTHKFFTESSVSLPSCVRFFTRCSDFECHRPGYIGDLPCQLPG